MSVINQRVCGCETQEVVKSFSWEQLLWYIMVLVAQSHLSGHFPLIFPSVHECYEGRSRTSTEECSSSRSSVRAQLSLWSTSPSTLVHKLGYNPPVVLTEAKQKGRLWRHERQRKGRGSAWVFPWRGCSPSSSWLGVAAAAPLQVGVFLFLHLWNVTTFTFEISFEGTRAAAAEQDATKKVAPSPHPVAFVSGCHTDR